MFNGAGQPKNVWAEAIVAACYIKNRFTSSRNSTPHELWSGTKPDTSGLRMKGCIAFAHVPKEKRKPLEDRSEDYIVIGYGFGNVYRLVTKIVTDIKYEEKKDAQAPIKSVLARKVHSRKLKKCNLCLEYLFFCKKRKI